MNCLDLTPKRRRASKRGTTVPELVVAATLLVSAIGAVTPLAVSAGRLGRDTRVYRLAVDELANQLARLSALDEEERAAVLHELTPSEEVRDALPQASLVGRIVEDEDGTRLVLSLDWQRPVDAPPLELVGWLDALPAQSAPPADTKNASTDRSAQEVDAL